jgi:hypothetical protein
MAGLLQLRSRGCGTVNHDLTLSRLQYSPKTAIWHYDLFHWDASEAASCLCALQKSASDVVSRVGIAMLLYRSCKADHIHLFAVYLGSWICSPNLDRLVSRFSFTLCNEALFSDDEGLHSLHWSPMFILETGLTTAALQQSCEQERKALECPLLQNTPSAMLSWQC